MKKYLVIGNPISHSLSPRLHNYWIKENNINAIYEKKKIREEELIDLIEEVKKKNINGINVTVPFKNIVISYLDTLSEEAEKTQSVNTIYLKKGKVVGHNTDIQGFEIAMKNTKFDLKNKKVFILGAGGVVPSIIYALNKMHVSKILISNRTLSKVNQIKNIFSDIEIINWLELPQFDVIINATSLGLKREDNIDLDFSTIGKGKLFYDVIYNPKETNFLKIGKELGNKSENGMFMFIYQAFLAFKLWHGIEPEINNEAIKLLEK